MARKDLYKIYAHVLYDVTKDKKGAELSRILQKFVELLARRQNLSLASRILVEFERYAKKKNGIITIQVSSAHKIEDKTLDAIKKPFGDTVEAITDIKQELLGGVTIQSEDIIFNASLKAQLQLLKQTLLA